MEDGGVTANLKRESRAYSYEDQKWDLQMRREMSQRRRLMSGSEEVQDMLREATLTQKQRESIEAQLQHEDRVRQRLTQLDQMLEAVEVLLDMLCGHKECVPLLPLLVDPVLSCMNSPLAGPRCLAMWRRMSESVLQNRRTGMSRNRVCVLILTLLLLLLLLLPPSPPAPPPPPPAPFPPPPPAPFHPPPLFLLSSSSFSSSSPFQPPCFSSSVCKCWPQLPLTLLSASSSLSPPTYPRCWNHSPL